VARAIGVVVQPGVEFARTEVILYKPEGRAEPLLSQKTAFRQLVMRQPAPDQLDAVLRAPGWRLGGPAIVVARDLAVTLAAARSRASMSFSLVVAKSSMAEGTFPGGWLSSAFCGCPRLTTSSTHGRPQ
jgi:hypothetical protein